MDIRRSLRWIEPMLLSVVLTQQVRALDIELSFPDGFATRTAACSTMEQAAAVWERMLRDPVTVRLDVYEVDSAELDGAQGGTAITYDFLDYSYADFRGALLNDATSANDALANTHLQPSPRLAFRTWDADMHPALFDGDEWANNYVSVPRATARALGLPHEDKGPDAEIYWNTSVLDSDFDYDRTDGIDGTDFLAVVMHEIGHALGFTGGVGFVEAVFTGDFPIPPEFLPELPLVEPLDLFRYSLASGPATDLNPGGNPFFSIDGGVTNLATFASGENFGNGDQPDHWQDGSGIMDAYLDDDTEHNLSLLDLTAIDVIGWDLALAGDYNANGVVDAADYVVWRKNDNTAVTLPNDSTAGTAQTDYAVWRAHFCQPSGSGSGTSANATIPEPSTLVLLILAAVGWRLQRRRAGFEVPTIHQRMTLVNNPPILALVQVWTEC